MTLSQAEEVKKNNMKIIGTENEKGFLVSDIWILPSKEELRRSLIVQFLQDNATNINLDGYEHVDMVVWAVDTRNLKPAGLLTYNELRK